MKDLDFDELDKAVNSLMSKTGPQDADSAAPATPPVAASDMPLTAAPVTPGTIKPKSEIATNPDLQPAITPQPASSVAGPQPIIAPDVHTSPMSRPAAPASRRGGRFMDVVSKKPVAAPARAVSRQATTIVPRADTATSFAAASEPLSSPPVSAAPTPQPPKITEKVAPSSDWPDPIEMTAPAKKDVDLQEKKEVPSQFVAPQPEPTPEKSEEKLTDQPLSSPFLPDTKVEKRPLGSTKPLVPMLAPEHELMAAQPDDSNAQLPARPSDVAPETPEEFNGDLIAVESDTHMGVPKTDETHPVEELAKVEKPFMQPSKNEVKDEGAVPVAPLESKTEEVEEADSSEPAMGRISIPPQYKEQPTSGETTSGAIYDTDTYHQPLSHPAKKKSGWLWVVWIILILVVGAGVGAALYFLGVM